MTDLVKRLRSPAAVFYEYSADNGLLLNQAADRIEELDRYLTMSGKVSKALSERIEALEAERETVEKIAAWLRGNATLAGYHWGVALTDAIEAGEWKQ